jgi:peptide/nickel transport system ATP-binding protein
VNIDKDKNILLEIEDLSVSFRSENQIIRAVDNVSFQLRRGETLGIVGESGSGKSVTALSILNLIQQPPGLIENGKIMFRSDVFGIRNLLELSAKQMRTIRGGEISIIFQEPMSSLNPVYMCGDQIVEALRTHEHLNHQQAKEKTLHLLREVLLNRPDEVFKSYPHELSGGQKQRVMIAMALSCNPAIMIADEPTTALDVTVQANILRLMEHLQDKHNMSLIFITHDLGVVAEIADRVLVMYSGKSVESGNIFELYADPKHPYTRGLLACRPRLDVQLKRLPTVRDFFHSLSDKTTKEEEDKKYRSIGEAILLNAELKEETIQKRLKVIKGGPLLKVTNLKTHFPVNKGIFGKAEQIVKAVDDVSFEVYPGETIGLVGESGCGKTTLGRSLLRLEEPLSGEIYFDGLSVMDMKAGALRTLRRNMQIIFQDPYSSLNPRLTVGSAIMEPMKVHRINKDPDERKEIALSTMEKVGLGKNHFNRFPHEFSGGQRQRISIARALVLQPRFIICDESVSALDVSVQAQVLNLLNDLKTEFNFTYIFISHDLSVVKFMADRIFVMNAGKLVEIGYPDAIFGRPKEEYTRKLINAIPKGDLDDVRKAQLRRRLTSAKKSFFQDN